MRNERYLETQIELERAEVNFTTAKETLALLWGSIDPDFEYVDFPLFNILPPPSLASCCENLASNPAIVESQFRYLAASRLVKLEEAQRIPDLLVGVGYKSFQDSSNRGVILEASLPLPIFDRNKGNIYRAKAEASEQYQKQIELQQRLQQKLCMSYRELSRAYAEALRYETTVLRSASEAFQNALEGYKEGKFEYLEVLDMQQMLVDAKERYIQALVTYQEKLADIEYLNTQEL
jgi:outer membrane protein, heavy metal efflux system